MLASFFLSLLSFSAHAAPGLAREPVCQLGDAQERQLMELTAEFQARLRGLEPLAKDTEVDSAVRALQDHLETFTHEPLELCGEWGDAAETGSNLDAPPAPRDISEGQDADEKFHPQCTVYRGVIEVEKKKAESLRDQVRILRGLEEKFRGATEPPAKAIAERARGLNDKKSRQAALAAAKKLDEFTKKVRLSPELEAATKLKERGLEKLDASVEALEKRQAGCVEKSNKPLPRMRYR